MIFLPILAEEVNILNCCVNFGFSLPISFAGFILDCCFYSLAKKEFNEKNGSIVELEHLKKMLDLKKEELLKLTENKKHIVEKRGFYVEKVHDEEKIKNFENISQLYYDIGYNESKYYKYMNKGTLEKELCKYYYDEDIEVVKDYFNKNQKQLKKVRKKY